MTDLAQPRRAARRLRRMANVTNVRVHDLKEAATVDFHLRAPPEADVPPPERGPSASRSVLLFDRDGRFKRVTIRYPQIEIDRYGPHRIDPLLDEVIEPLDPPHPPGWWNSIMDETAVPHYKSFDTPGWGLDDALDFIANSTQRFNDVFYGGNPHGTPNGNAASAVFAAGCSLTAAGRELVSEVAPEVARRRSLPPESFWVEHGLEVVGVGEDRVVAAPPDADCVIKFSREHPPEQNTAEIANWNAAPPGVRDVLAPVVEHGEPALWLVMPRARAFGTPVDLVRIEDALSDHGWSCRGLNTDNIGVFDGQPKAFDYGFPCIANGERVT